MASSATLTFGDVLIVHEGAARLRWQPIGEGRQSPVQIWPGLAERRDLEEHLERGAPTLVVFPYVDSPVELLLEETSGMPNSLFLMIEQYEAVCQLRIPELDWLPEPHSGRGRAFLASCREWARTTPKALLPPVVLDDTLNGTDAIATGRSVRFAWQTSHTLLRPDAWRELAQRVFSAQPAGSR